MPVVLVIIIVAAWAVILGPNLLKRRARGGGDQSITHFHYQLRVLEQRAPEPIVAPAYRLRAVDGSGTPTSIHYPDDGRPPVLSVVGAKELPRPALAFLGDPEPEVVAPVPASDADRTRPGRPGPAAVPAALPAAGAYDGHDAYGDPYARDHRAPAAPAGIDHARRVVESSTRARARRRRRDTLAVLAAVFGVTVLAGLVTGSSVAWAVAGLDGVALAGYVALLVHLRRMALEREHKLRYLDPYAARPPRVDGLPTHVSGRYAHPSSQQAVAH
jgi:hypothetical protein